MGQRGWYYRALAEIRSTRELVLAIEGKPAQVLRAHLPVMVHLKSGFGWRNVVNMVRFGRLHRLYFSALALGLGVTMEGDDKRLILRMDDALRNGVNLLPGSVILGKPRTATE